MRQLCFAERLKSARVQVGKTQKSVAESIGVHVVTYANWEGGRMRPTSEHVERAAGALGVHLLWLLTGQGRRRARLRAA